MERIKIKNGCTLKTNERGHLIVCMPDGKEIQNISGKTIEQNIHEAKAGIAMVKLGIFCMVHPDADIKNNNESISIKSPAEILDGIRLLKALIGAGDVIGKKNEDNVAIKIKALEWVLNITQGL